MATNNYWVGDLSTTYETAGNWSLGHVPIQGVNVENAVWDSTSPNDCVISVDQGYAGLTRFDIKSTYLGAKSENDDPA